MRQNNGTGAYHIGLFGRPTIYMNPERGRGAGGGQPNPGNDDDNDDDPGPDEEQKFTERFNRLFHKAMSEREKRLESRLMKGLEATLGTKLSDILSKVDEKFESIPRDSGDDKERGNKLPPEFQAQLAQMQKDLAATKEISERHRREAEEQKAKGRRVEEINSLTQLLTGAVKPALLDMVVSNLHSNLTRDDESDAIYWKGQDGELLTMKDGVEAWKKSDAGKEVAPPRPAQGSGSSGGSGTAPVRPGDFSLESLGNILGGTGR